MEGLLPPKWIAGLRWLLFEHLFETVLVAVIVLVGLVAARSAGYDWRPRV